MIIKTELSITLISNITHHKSRNRPTRNTSRKPHTPDKCVTFAATQISMREIVTKGDQQIESNKYHTTKKRVEPRQYVEPQETNNEQYGMTACIALEVDVLSYVPLKFPNNQHRKALIDTGACANAICEKDYEDLKLSFGTTTPISQPSEVSKVKLASGQLVPERGRIQLDFSIAEQHFNDKFLVLPSTNCNIPGNPFFKNNSIELYPSKNLMKLPDLTLQLNEISTHSDKVGKPQYTIRTVEKFVIAPNQQTTLKCTLQTKNPIC